MNNNLSTPAILACALNGARKSKADHRNLPLTLTEIVSTAIDCLNSGANMLHLHVRDPKGRHTLDPHIYKTTIQAIKAEIGEDLVIQVTTESGGIFMPEQQMKAIYALKPQAVSVSIREIMSDKRLEDKAIEFFNWLGKEKISSQYILYDDHDIKLYRHLLAQGNIPEGNRSLLFVLGKYNTKKAKPEDLTSFLSLSETKTPWMVCAFGEHEHQCAMAALELGGHVRVGFENNIHDQFGNIAENNAVLIKQVKQQSIRPIASVEQVRQMLVNQ